MKAKIIFQAPGERVLEVRYWIPIKLTDSEGFTKWSWIKPVYLTQILQYKLHGIGTYWINLKWSFTYDEKWRKKEDQTNKQNQHTPPGSIGVK